MRAFFFIIIIMGIIASGCQKKEDYKDITDQYKTYFLFKEGSSWIYYNYKIHGNDSVVLRNITSVATKPDNVCSEYRYEYKMQFTSVTTGTIFHSQTNCIASTEISDGLTSALISAPPVSLTHHLDTLWVNSHRYTNVLAYQDTSANHQVFVAYAPGIGRIKSFEMLNGDTLANYEILRYHVSPF
jgi:hypothetical protein